MPTKKNRESRAQYTVEGSRAGRKWKSQRAANPKTPGQRSSSTGSRRSRAVQPKDISLAMASLADINQTLLELKASLAEVQQRLSAFEEQAALVSDAQKRLAALGKTAAEDLGWLSLAESAFAFWDNTEDEVYDTI